ncbi:MAG TPA: hypothetical protein ENJ95_06905 [Bacteroidetes bacterium]|nr:hypothetical protein [Bacteroidota bacterium]
MNKLYLLTFFAFLLLFSKPANASEGDRFSNDRSSFIGELGDFLHADDNKEMAALLIEMEAKLNGEVFCESAFNKMVALCNRMSEMKMKAKPYFSNYIKSVCAWHGDCSSHCALEEWHDVYGQLLDRLEGKSLKPYADLLVFAQQFYEKGALRYKKSGTSWLVDQKAHEVKWDGQQPVLVIKNTRLEAIWKSKKMAIESTSGSYYPFKNIWQGKGGHVSWSVIEPGSKIEAELVEYEVNLTKKEYTATEALLTHPGFFGDKRVRGKFSDKLLNTRTSSKSTYPRFVSTSASVEIPGVFKGVNYRGGFSLSGLKAEGVATPEAKASLEILDASGKIISRMEGERIALVQNGSFSAKSMAVEIKMGGEGTLSHPCVNIKYQPGKKISFQSNEKSASKSPYYDSYHKVFLFADRLQFDIKTGNLNVNPKAASMGGQGQRVYVESESFFDKNLYNRIQNVATVHPLAVIAAVARHEGNTFDAAVLAPKINPNFNVESIQRLLFNLEQDGFLRYNPKTKIVQVLDRTFHYVDAAAGKNDNDRMRFESDSEKTNATINTSDKTIEMEGVKHFMLHPRPRVAVKPKDGKVTLKKNRGAEFDGRIFAGFGVLEGEGFDFDYEKFQVEAGQVSTFDMYLPTGETDKNGQPKGAAIGSRIENTKGILLVNAPGNKSGKELIKLFPTFMTTAPAFVFYDKRNKQGGVYAREDFFFELEPFTFNSLSNIKPEILTFKGKMVSAGIFPDFEETLVFQEHDQSLGFVTTTPAEGYAAYSKGNYKGDINLSNGGFKGVGELSYLATDFAAEDFLFKPKQATATAEVFDLQDDVAKQVPSAHGEDVSINWLPQADSMFITSKGQSFDLFSDGSHKVDGLLIYTPDGLKARGKFGWEDGEMQSELFSFGHHSIKTESADLQIKSMSTEGVALNTNNLKGLIDFDTQKGKFAANDAKEETKMPANKYKTSLNNFEWDLANKTLTFIAPADTKGWFLSTDKAQDSLFFAGATATFDFENTELNVTEVSEIRVADALIVPYGGQLKIGEDGKMMTLKNARIVADTKNKYHQIVNATVNVKGRESFSGKGFYEYNVEGKPQLIELKRITGKGAPGGQKTFTAAEAEIEESDNFFMDSQTRFIGGVSLKSSDPWLGFKGFAQLQTPVLSKQQWFEVEFKGDYKNLLIACDEPKNREGETLQTGLYVGFENAWNYANVLMPERSKRDRELFTAKGVVRYDVGASAYEFGEAEKMDAPLAKGNVLVFDNKKATVKATGSFNICPNMKELGLKVAGIAETGLEAKQLADPSKAKTGIDASFVAGFDFKLPKNLMKIMLADFAANSFDAQPVVYDNESIYRTAIAEWAVKEKTKTAAYSSLVSRRVFDLLEDSPASFVLGELDMQWNSELQSFTTKKDAKTALNSMGGQGIHRYIKALVEFHMPSNKDDRIYLLLTSNSGSEYYFNYKKGILHVYSSNEEFNQEVENMNEKARTIEAVKGQPYELQLTTPDLVDFFKRRVGE